MQRRVAVFLQIVGCGVVVGDAKKLTIFTDPVKIGTGHRAVKVNPLNLPIGVGAVFVGNVAVQKEDVPGLQGVPWASAYPSPDFT